MPLRLLSANIYILQPPVFALLVQIKDVARAALHVIQGTCMRTLARIRTDCDGTRCQGRDSGGKDGQPRRRARGIRRFVQGQQTTGLPRLVAGAVLLIVGRVLCSKPSAASSQDPTRVPPAPRVHGSWRRRAPFIAPRAVTKTLVTSANARVVQGQKTIGLPRLVAGAVPLVAHTLRIDLHLAIQSRSNFDPNRMGSIASHTG
ncbi:hypothetical protein AURDEDRAFT_173005 [Auricularia subglabra TFB-10046 SS5]|uniref:Uncharacterized protein n=1 Tax=Auricularia subglabra (strain TFB-10046 / SS5) TaxID=717982 RepID=J0D0G6_AURST|nr:hypothetical protein AURDEDRAFT_173005 [Auricularia subglabra TFB-10046 SS5]